MTKLFDTKRAYTGYDGDTYIDLSIPVVDVSKLRGYTTMRLNQDENGRLDTFVWNQVAQDLDMIDITMYANHIYNPFAVKDGDLLYVPVQDDDAYETPEEPSLPDGSKHSENNSGEKSMTYAEKIEYLAKKGLGVK